MAGPYPTPPPRPEGGAADIRPEVLQSTLRALGHTLLGNNNSLTAAELLAIASCLSATLVAAVARDDEAFAAQLLQGVGAGAAARLDQIMRRHQGDPPC